MKMILTIIPANIVTNSLLSSFCPFLKTKSKNQIFIGVGDLVMRNVFVFV